ncbi:uncharacterized protein sync [Odontesthes bonariensis]|uniref:uncharacterized protein sync n=1 Tax=Odontesthes bonariensis TaxID=219752 RepID=UPI003F585EC8
MDDLNDDLSSTGFEPLFIKEEQGDPDRSTVEERENHKNPSGLTETQLKQSALIKPYLQEMDDLLRSCEELTGISLSSQYSATYNKTSWSESNPSQGKEEVATESYGGTASQAYLSTSYIDTHIEEVGKKEEPAQSEHLGTNINSYDVSHQMGMPLTSAGNKLRETMVDYEGQLLGMLAKLDSCMEEAGMDFEPQDWVADSSQEYVHIRKNPHHCRGTTLVPVMQERPLKLDTQPMQFEAFVDGDKPSEDGRRRIPVDSATDGSQNLLPSCETLVSFPVETPEGRSNFKEDRGVQFSFSGLKMLLDTTDQDPIYRDETKTGHVLNEGTETNGDVTGTDADHTQLPAEERNEVKMHATDLGSGTDELTALRSQMEVCIQEVQRLEKRRREQLVEVLQLRGQKEREEEEETEEVIDNKVVELMEVIKREEEGRREERKMEIHSLKEERAEEERKMWKVNLERQGLQEELRKLKRKLFATARDCALCQAAMNNQRREVELLKREEEKMNSLFLQLTEEGCQLRSAHLQQLLDLQAKRQAQSSNQTSNTQEELTEGRRNSCGDVQQYVQGGLKALEDRYEPVLLALLKRREAAAGALVKAKEQAQELRAQLRPLREEIQKLQLQRACLEEKLKLIHIQRREDVGRYKETVHSLEESGRELKTELEIQKRKTKEMEELRDRLAKQLLLHRAATEDHNKHDREDTT